MVVIAYNLESWKQEATPAHWPDSLDCNLSSKAVRDLDSDKTKQ